MKIPSQLELMVVEQATKDVVAAVGEYHPYYAVTALSVVLATKIAALPETERGLAIAIINEHLPSVVKNFAE